MSVTIKKKKPPTKSEADKHLKAKLSPPEGAIDFVKGAPNKEEKLIAAEAKIEQMEQDGEINKQELMLLEPDARRVKMWEMKLKGYPVEVILEVYGVSRATYFRDMTLVDERLAYELNRAGPLGVVARAYSFFQHIRDEVMFTYEGLDAKSSLKDKVDLLRLAKDVEDSRTKMLLAVGAIPMSRKGNVADEMQAPEDVDFTPADARKIFSKMIELEASVASGNK